MQSGNIQLDGIDVRELQQSSLRRAVAVVPQDTVLFADTILRNIRYGRPDASFEEIEKAAGPPSMLSLLGYCVWEARISVQCRCTPCLAISTLMCRTRCPDLSHVYVCGTRDGAAEEGH